MNKKAMVALCVATVAVGAFARPHGGPMPAHRPAPVRRVHHAPAPHHAHRHKHSVWGHGGCNFWPGFVGGVVGGAIGSALADNTCTHETVVVQQPVTTTVVTAPVVVAKTTTTETIWVEGRYLDQVQPNGTVVRVWQPGHYETRTVVY